MRPCGKSSSPGRAFAVSLDLRLPDSAAHLVTAALTRFGQIDILINNAGATKRGEFTELSDEDWIDGFALKFFGAVRLTRAMAAFEAAVGLGGPYRRSWRAHAGSAVRHRRLGERRATLVYESARRCGDSRRGTGQCDQSRIYTHGSAGQASGRYRSGHGDRRSAASENLVRDSNITRLGDPEDIAGLVSFVVSPAGKLLQGSLIDMDGGQTKTI